MRNKWVVIALSAILLVLGNSSVLAYSGGYLHGKVSVKQWGNVPQVTDGNTSTYYDFTVRPAVNNADPQYKWMLGYELGTARITVNSYRLLGTGSFSVDLIDGNGQYLEPISLIPDGELHQIPEKTNIKAVHLTNASTSQTARAYEFDVFYTSTDNTPPSVPTLTGNAGDASIALNWSQPSDSDLAGYNVYRNGIKQNAILLTVRTFEQTGLTNGVTYSYTVTSVDQTGNESVKSNVVSLKPEAPPNTINPPSGINASSINQGLVIRWNPLSVNVTGYNIYVDGLKVNNVPVNNKTYLLTGLTNGQQYQIRITSVLGALESDLSAPVVGTPSVNSPPLIDLDYKLVDISTGVSNWFGSIWLILAFAIAIPVSFLVGRRVKELF